MEQQKLPNSTLILVLSIASILTCCVFYGSVGLITSITALILAQKALKVYAENPELYSNVQTIKTSRILAIVGLVLTLIMIAFVIFAVMMFGWEAMQDQELMKERMEELLQ